MKFGIFLLAAANALYFEISERDKKCFIEELPDDTQMIGKYLVQVFDKQTKVISLLIVLHLLWICYPYLIDILDTQFIKN